jgi:hypothetical protein
MPDRFLDVPGTLVSANKISPVCAVKKISALLIVFVVRNQQFDPAGVGGVIQQTLETVL